MLFVALKQVSFDIEENFLVSEVLLKCYPSSSLPSSSSYYLYLELILCKEKLIVRLKGHWLRIHLVRLPLKKKDSINHHYSDHPSIRSQRRRWRPSSCRLSIHRSYSLKGKQRHIKANREWIQNKDMLIEREGGREEMLPHHSY